MSSLTDFLLARIAEDEAAQSVVRHDYWCSWNQAPGEPCDCPRRRMLAECEAKRRIVEHNDYVHLTNDPLAKASHDKVLHHLAAVYADHPDYRHEWRP